MHFQVEMEAGPIKLCL